MPNAWRKPNECGSCCGCARKKPPRPIVETLDRAERLGLIASADTCLAARKLRHRLVHEYVEDRNELAANLSAARAFVPTLRLALDNVKQATDRLNQQSST